MIDNLAILLALRTLAQTLSVTTTGSTSLSATATGYARLAGSFVSDGFVVGQEVTPAAFTATTPGVITAIATLTMTIAGGRTAESATSGRTLSVGLPANRAWENVSLTPIAKRWHVIEQYLPGPASQITLGPLGEIETLPQYVLTLYGIEKTGAEALSKAADALLALFAPRTPISVAVGSSLTVRTDVAPTRSQIRHGEPGWSFTTLKIPLRYRTANSY